MKLMPLVDENELREARDALVRQLTEGIQPLRRTVGHVGASDMHDLYWRPHDGLWCFFELVPDEQKYWCAYGTVDPTHTYDLNIGCEINSVVRSYSKLYGGIFAGNVLGDRYLVHSGTITGRPGVGKKSFVTWYTGGDKVSVEWPDGTTSEAFLIGRFGSSHLPRNIAAFTRVVEQFKREFSLPRR